MTTPFVKRLKAMARHAHNLTDALLEAYEREGEGKPLTEWLTEKELSDLAKKGLCVGGQLTAAGKAVAIKIASRRIADDVPVREL